MAPTYSRVRQGADQWRHHGDYGHRHRGYGYGYGFYQPYYQPIVAGTYYERPYPYHFDYYRHRWGAQESPAPVADCPCATEGVTPAVP